MNDMAISPGEAVPTSRNTRDVAGSSRVSPVQNENYLTSRIKLTMIKQVINFAV